MKRWAAAVLLLLFLGIVGNESRIGTAADRVASAAATQKLEEIGKSWDQYDSLLAMVHSAHRHKQTWTFLESTIRGSCRSSHCRLSRITSECSRG